MNEDHWFLYIIAAVFISVSSGFLLDSAAGFLIFGSLLMCAVIISAILSYLDDNSSKS